MMPLKFIKISNRFTYIFGTKSGKGTDVLKFDIWGLEII